MLNQCVELGVGEKCLPVYHELLVLNPKLWLKRIIAFLDLPWNDALLKHQEFIDPEGTRGESADLIQLSRSFLAFSFVFCDF